MKSHRLTILKSILIWPPQRIGESECAGTQLNVSLCPSVWSWISLSPNSPMVSFGIFWLWVSDPSKASSSCTTCVLCSASSLSMSREESPPLRCWNAVEHVSTRSRETAHSAPGASGQIHVTGRHCDSFISLYFDFFFCPTIDAIAFSNDSNGMKCMRHEPTCVGLCERQRTIAGSLEFHCFGMLELHA